MNYKNLLKRTLSILLVISMILSMILPTNSILAQVQNNERTNFTPKYNIAEKAAFDYALLATEDKSVIEINASMATIDASIYSSGDFTYTGSQLNLIGECNTAGKISTSNNANISRPLENIVKLQEKNYIEEIREMVSESCDTYEQDVEIKDSTYTTQKDILIKGNLKISTAILNASSYILAEKDIEINTSFIRTNKEKPLIIVSENGNVNIKSSIDEINGIIYAPNGNVTIDTTSFNLNGKIIAKNIYIKSSSITVNDNKEYAEKYLTIMPSLKLEDDNGELTFLIENKKPQFDYRLEVERYELPVKELCSIHDNTTLTIEKEKYFGIYHYFITLHTESRKTFRSNEINYNIYYNGEGVIGVDYDRDGIDDMTEVYIENTDPYDPDSDGDGLNDGYEKLMTLTDPLIADSDNNGIIDAEEDFDHDQLSNWQEYQNGTDPYNEDTDGDRLTDYDEIYIYFTDPLNPDTDRDGLEDGAEIKLGFNPLNPDTNGNGILDGDEKIEQTIGIAIDTEENQQITKVEVKIDIAGDIEETTLITNTYNKDMLSTDVVGLIGVPVEIETSSNFDKANIIFHYDESKLGETKEEDLCIMYYDEENNFYEILDEETIIDTINNTVSYETTHFSTYLVVDRQVWYKTWMNQRKYTREPGTTGDPTEYFDIGYVIDQSGSMLGDNINTAKEATKSFIDAMHAKDSGCVVGFNSSAIIHSDFTKDKNTLKNAINKIVASGGTSVNDGLIKTMDLFEKNKTPNPTKMIILLCDGDVNATENTIQRAIQMKVKIYPILVGYNQSSQVLQRIADRTGGTFYYVTTAEEMRKALFGIKDTTIGDIDTTDSDNDGLYDIYETAGMMIPNGKYIYTDPLKWDTDGDKLSDGEEMGVVKNVGDLSIVKQIKLNFKGLNTEIYAQYFDYKSHPEKRDTDGDTYDDNIDAEPLKHIKNITYIFYEKGGDWFLKSEALSRENRMRLMYKTVKVVAVDSESSFIDRWNAMGVNKEGKATYHISDMYTIFHGNPEKIIIKYNWRKKIDEFISADNINKLIPKKIDTLHLSSCNNGNLDWINTAKYGEIDFKQNISITFLKRFKDIKKVIAADGYLMYIAGMNITTDGEDFSKWSINKNNGRLRLTTGMITYTRDNNGAILYKPNVKYFEDTLLAEIMTEVIK